MSLLVALQFLSKIPLSIQLDKEDLRPAMMARRMVYFPLAGLVMGIILMAADYLFQLILPSMVAAAFLLVFFTALTGGLHMDGFMDSLDGIWSFTSKKKCLEIMKDSNIGAYAAVGLMLLLLMKFVLFLQLPTAVRSMGLLIMPALSRWTMVFAAYIFDNARGEGLGHLFSSEMTLKKFLVSTLFVLPLPLLLEPLALLLLPLLLLSTLLMGKRISSLLEGLTGDNYGLINEVNEVLCLLLILILGGWG